MTKLSKCRVCMHPDLEDIDAALTTGMSDTNAERRWGVSHDSIRRHRLNHLTAELRKASLQRRTERSGRSALERLEDLYGRTERLLDELQTAGATGQLLKALKETRDTLQVIARITGELDDSTKVQMVNVSASPEWLQIRQVILAELAPHPEAARAVAERLVELERPDGDAA